MNKENTLEYKEELCQFLKEHCVNFDRLYKELRQEALETPRGLIDILEERAVKFGWIN